MKVVLKYELKNGRYEITEILGVKVVTLVVKEEEPRRT